MDSQWLGVIKVHLIFTSFLTFANLITAVTATRIASKIAKLGDEPELEAMHKSVTGLSVWLWLWFVLMFLGTMLVMLTPFMQWAVKLGEYILLCVILGQTVLFLSTIIVSSLLLSKIKATDIAKTVRIFLITSLIAFLTDIGYIVYISSNIFNGGIKKYSS